MSYSKVKGGDIDLAPAEICCSLLHSLRSLRTQSKIKLLFFTRTLRCGARAWLRQEEPEQHHQWLLCAQGETQFWHTGEKQRLCWNIISEISARYFNHFSFSPPCYYHLLSYYYFTTTDSLLFTPVNPYFCNPYYYPWQEENEIWFWLLPKINKQTKQKLFILSLKSHEL